MRGSGRTATSTRTAAALGAVLLVAGLAVGYLVGHSQASTTFTYTFQTTAPSPSTSTTQCSISAEGAVQIRIIPDAVGQAIDGPVLQGTLHNQCGDFNTNRFTLAGGGWLSPTLNTTAIGTFIISIQYSGKVYTYPALIEPQKVTCVTARLPSGNFTSSTYQIGNGATCPLG